MGGAGRGGGPLATLYCLYDGGNDGWILGLALAEAPWERLRFPPGDPFTVCPHSEQLCQYCHGPGDGFAGFCNGG